MRDPDSVDVSDDLPPWRDWIDRARDAVDRVRRNLDADLALQASMAGLIELAATRYAVDPGAQWRPGEPLKLLFAGYTGTRNTGADVRVQEMIRQVRHLLGEAHSELYVTTIDPARSQGYYRGGVQLESLLPMEAIEAAASARGLTSVQIDYGTSGNYLSGFLGLHGLYYANLHEHAVAAGHIHVANGLPVPTAETLIELTLQVVLETHPADGVECPPRPR